MVRSRFPVVAVAVLVLATGFAADQWVYEHWVYRRVYDEDWGRLLRVMGFWPTWLAAAIALVLTDWPERARAGARRVLGRGAVLIGAVTASGVAGELLKLLFRRQRPGADYVAYAFRPWSDRPLHNGGLSFPSTHAVVAFGAAVALTRLFPRAWPVWWALATGCALTRVLAQAHYLSDVVGAGIVAWLAGEVVLKKWQGTEERAEPGS
ncbi:MAG: phosphatase PAP2 family protein [Gemmatimonadetes bacterium]|nr:phosphatase PAP2 family protein [Gemmatimonadota bacterium]